MRLVFFALPVPFVATFLFLACLYQSRSDTEFKLAQANFAFSMLKLASWFNVFSLERGPDFVGSRLPGGETL